MMEKEKKVKICPSAEELEDECKTNVACPIVGCAKTFAQPSALRFHVVKVHKIISNDTDARLANRKRCELECRQFHCPAEGCVYNEQRAKHFTSYKALKQHYLKVHAVKKFKCPSCGSQFGVRSDLNRHLVNFCSEDLSCTTCKIRFTDRRTLLNHCSMTGHSTPEMRPKSRPKPANIDPSKDKPASLVLQSEKRTPSMNCESNALDSEKIPIASNCTSVSDNISSLLDCCSTIVSSSTISNNPGRSKAQGSHSFKTLVPKPSSQPVPSRLEAGKNYVVVYTLPSSLKQTSSSMLKSLAPKPEPIRNFETRKNSILNADTIPVDEFISCSDSRGLNDQQRPNDYQFKTISTQTIETRGHEIQVAETQTIRGHVIQVAETQTIRGHAIQMAETQTIRGHAIQVAETQTIRSRGIQAAETQTIRGHGIQVAETQTTEHFLARSLSGNRLSQSKESRGSQVSPRAKEKQGTQSSHTQTLGDSFRVGRRRRTRSTNRESNVEMSAVPIESDPSYMAWMMDDQWPDLTNNQTQTMNILKEFEASIAESISTQTLESYLVDNFFDTIQQNSQDPSQSTTMFQRTMQDVSNHSFIRSPISPSNAGMNDGMPPTFRQMENNFLSDVIPTLNSNFTTENAGDVNLVALDPRYDTISCQTEINCSAETQTSDLPESLINFQPDFDASLMHMETQTADDCDLLDIFSNMETQTGDDFFSDLGFSDIETQTHHWDDWCTAAATAQTQTTFQGIGSSFLLDMETQTCFQY